MVLESPKERVRVKAWNSSDKLDSRVCLGRLDCLLLRSGTEAEHGNERGPVSRYPFFRERTASYEVSK